jgi:DNA primase
MSSQTEQIKAKLSIADVVGSYLKLERAGGNFKARCPFHNEKTPSFYVSPSRDSYHCFGCSRGGDIFSFVQEIEGVDFLGSLEVLAARAGVELKPVDLRAKSETERQYAVIEEAAKFYHTNLLQSAEAKDYLKKRNIKEETVRGFRLGFARPEWGTLYEHLARKGFKDEEMEKAGLVIRTSQSIRHAGGRYYDRFRGRVVFPLCDGSGRVVGFSGRILIQSGDHEEAKYINTPQTPLYDKSRVLFGYDKARQEIRKQDACVLVEGQMDLVSSHQAGVKNCVAVSGTALTGEHLNLIKRMTDNLIVTLDADAAGISASKKSFLLALEKDFKVKAALLPDGLDPADLIAKDENEWRAAVSTSIPIIEFLINSLMRRNYNRLDLSINIEKEVLPFVEAIQSSIEQGYYVDKISNVTGIKDDYIIACLKKLSSQRQNEVREVEPEPVKQIGSKINLIERKLFGLMYWFEGRPEAAVAEFPERLAALLGGRFNAKKAEYDDRRDELSLEAELTYDGNEFLAQETADLLSAWREESVREEMAELLTKLKAEPDNAEYLRRLQDLGREKEALKKAGGGT